MPHRLPAAVPEIPVSAVNAAVDYYVRAPGFVLDWNSGSDGIAGISHGDCRMFLTSAAFRSGYGNGAPVVVWINLESREAVDALYGIWHAAGANILSQPEDKPWNLHEFRAADADGNQLRVFYDFTWELKGQKPAP